jgi:hypothetical protein
MANDTSGHDLWNELVMQPSLSPREKALRDQFVEQYLIDYDAWAAAIRIGFLKSVAAQYAQELMECPYVRQQIIERQFADAQNPDAALKNEQKQIKASLMREAHYRGPGSSHGARVQALGKLAALAKMEGAEDEGVDKELALITAFKQFAQKVPV